MKPFSICLIAACSAFAQPAPVIISAAGGDAPAIQSAVDEFRAAVGSPLNAPGAAGEANGRREINWDAVPDQFASPNNLPAVFFNKNSVRGVVFSSNQPGWQAFQVSGNESAGPVRFENLFQGYASAFKVFSAQKLFTSVGSHVYDVDFFAPGTETRAAVNGFGAVFANVALPFTSTIEVFSPEGVLLGKYSARVAAGGLSFLGAVFPGKMVAKVRVTPGNTLVGQADAPASGRNVVVVDDFIYGEPVALACSR